MDHKIKPRAIKFTFSDHIDKHWFGNDPFKTHWLNSYTLIIPEGEKFIHRSTKRYLGQMDSNLKEQILGLLSQEILHSKEHERFFGHLYHHGYKIDGYLRQYNFLLYRVLEPFFRLLFGPKILLSTAAGLEHINAFIAEIGLSENFLSDAHPDVRALFEWHYAEEIEHKSAVFDVLKSVDHSYFLRAAGMAFATFTFFGALSAGTMMLLFQDRKLHNKNVLKEAINFFFFKQKFFFKFVTVCRDYLAPTFHPTQRDNFHLAAKVFERL